MFRIPTARHFRSTADPAGTPCTLPPPRAWPDTEVKVSLRGRVLFCWRRIAHNPGREEVGKYEVDDPVQGGQPGRRSLTRKPRTVAEPHSRKSLLDKCSPKTNDYSSRDLGIREEGRQSGGWYLRAWGRGQLKHLADGKQPLWKAGRQASSRTVHTDQVMDITGSCCSGFGIHPA